MPFCGLILNFFSTYINSRLQSMVEAMAYGIAAYSCRHLNAHKFFYYYAKEQATLPDLAAHYAIGSTHNHPFLDGNKRTALVACHTFCVTTTIASMRHNKSVIEKYTNSVPVLAPMKNLLHGCSAVPTGSATDR